MQEVEAQILFVLQEANFCPRVLLVPAREFSAARAEELKLLQEHAQSHVLIQNYICDEQGGCPEMHPWSQFIFHLLSLVDSQISSEEWLPSVFANEADRPWITKASFHVERDLFDASAVFDKLTTKNLYFDLFLVLERGHPAPLNPLPQAPLVKPAFKTNSEMMTKLCKK